MRTAAQILDDMPVGSVIGMPAIYAIPPGWAFVSFADLPGLTARPDRSRLLIEKKRMVSISVNRQRNNIKGLQSVE